MRVTGISYVQGCNSYTDADGLKYAIAIHNTSNTASAAAEASYATRRPDGVSSHFYVDATTVIQSLDTTARAGHAGSSQGNQNAIAVEIRGVNGWSRQVWLDSVCWDLLGRVLAQVCRAYGIPARRCTVAEMQRNAKVKGFYSHNDMRLAWGGTTHDDPGPNFPWDRLLAAVNAALNPPAATGPDEGDDMTLAPDERAILLNIDSWGRQFVGALDGPVPIINPGAPSAPPVPWPNRAADALKQLVAAAQEDKVRDTALAAAVQALAVGAGVDVDGLMDRVHAAVADAVKPLQDQLAAAQAREAKLVAALAAAGGALTAADD